MSGEHESRRALRSDPRNEIRPAGYVAAQLDFESPISEDFGQKCLLARRLVQRGVRFIQLYSGTQVGDDWDNAHTDLTGSHSKMCKKTDKPIAGLLADLAREG